ncbi:MAG TPA: electron transport complex subunit RsxE [Desulfobacteraceae bacterium]|nr:electron transport complex subunit RsxE [Desulfobacteraceae bacterium]
MAQSLAKEFTKGLWAELPPFRLVLGLCPVLAVTKTVENGLGMGIATTFVLVFSNLLVSMLRNVIPTKVRIACYIVIIATFVTIVEFLAQAFAYPLFLALGIFIPLIVVNCIVLGRAEAFASKNTPVMAIADGLGIGIGFTLSLGAIGLVREFLGAGTITIWGGTPVFDMTSVFANFQPFGFMIEAPGAFVALGLMLAVMNLIPSK